MLTSLLGFQKVDGLVGYEGIFIWLPFFRLTSIFQGPSALFSPCVFWNVWVGVVTVVGRTREQTVIALFFLFLRTCVKTISFRSEICSLKIG